MQLHDRTDLSSPPPVNGPPQHPHAHRLQWPHRLFLLVLLAAMVGGATALAFLCDDAYITFRYVSNAHAGHGLVWNPAPFLPVEGYTGFSWALLLWAVWSWSGVEPPGAANVLSILCGIGQFALLATAALRLRERDGSRTAIGIGLAALLGIVANRSFLQWQTSGLETALFNLALIGWVLLAFRQRRSARWLFCWSLAAALAALTRPDGLLLVAATAALALAPFGAVPASLGRRALGLAPLLAVAAHLAWRRSFYGEWLPNTYYAKVTGAWPEAGLRYFACFAVEHGVWLWLPLAGLWVLCELRRGPAVAWRALRTNLPAVAAVAVVLFHFAYYTVAVGGDHFEYRVYSHLVPLGGLAAATMVVRLWRGNGLRHAALILLGLTSSLGWAHLWLTREMPKHGFVPIAAQLPETFAPLTRWFDRQQAWLRFRMIGLRCNHHALFLADQQQVFPQRLAIVGAADPFPAFSTGAVGWVGWALPDAVIVDQHGLNDWVVARTPVRPFGQPPTPAQLRELIGRIGVANDGFLDPSELQHVIQTLLPQSNDHEGAAYLATLMLAIYGRERPGYLTLEEALPIGESLLGARSMAHERLPAPGYVETLEPNVVVQNGIARARPRQEPLTAARIEAFEALWRAKVRSGQLGW